MKTFVTLLATTVFFATAAFGQSNADERKVIEAALETHLAKSFIYVKTWAISSETEALPLGDPLDTWVEGASGDYLARNQVSLDLSGLNTPPNSVIADLRSFSGDTFDWSSFEKAFGSGTWTVRVSRPGFVDSSTAVVRIDVWAREKIIPPSTTVALVSRANDGHWKMAESTSWVRSQ